MSVLINGMDIPKSCSDCPLNYDEMSCAVTGTRWWSDTMVLLDFDYTKERLHDCPLSEAPSAQPDAVTASLEELINDYGEDGFFIVDGVNYQANELLNELKTNSSVGEKFRKQITKTIIQYFMKFGG